MTYGDNYTTNSEAAYRASFKHQFLSYAAQISQKRKTAIVLKIQATQLVHRRPLWQL